MSCAHMALQRSTRPKPTFLSGGFRHQRRCPSANIGRIAVVHPGIDGGGKRGHSHGEVAALGSPPSSLVILGRKAWVRRVMRQLPQPSADIRGSQRLGIESLIDHHVRLGESAKKAIHSQPCNGGHDFTFCNPRFPGLFSRQEREPTSQCFHVPWGSQLQHAAGGRNERWLRPGGRRTHGRLLHTS